MVGMNDGEIQTVKLECENRLAGVVIDRFGKDIQMLKVDTNHFITYINVAVSEQFLAWVIGLCRGVKVIGPECVVGIMRDEVRGLVEQYM